MRSILVIDDEKMVLNVIETALTAYGYEVEIARDGLEGIRKFDEGVFDLVITDLIMPYVDGNGVVDHIRNSRKKETPIIGMSGTPWVLERSSVDKVLTKPFPLRDLLEQVKVLEVSSVN